MESQLMTMTDLYKRLQTHTGRGSAYSVAALLGASNPTARRWRDGFHSMDDVLGIRAAQVLGLAPEYVLACLAAERAARAGQADALAIWERAALHLATAAGVFFLGFYSVLVMFGPLL